jgi:SAM-dependent methyltransferase
MYRPPFSLLKYNANRYLAAVLDKSLEVYSKIPTKSKGRWMEVSHRLIAGRLWCYGCQPQCREYQDMGLGGEFLKRVVDLKRRGSLEGFSSVIEIGSQQLSNSLLEADADLDELYSLSGRDRVALGNRIDAGAVGGLEILADDAPPSRLFWQSLGFRYACIDFDGHRDSFPLDLNTNDVPRQFRNAFDLVVNTGTTEHVANQDNAFRVIHELCRPGGIMIHELPAGGMMNHGLFNYNLKFFWHLCRENNYQPIYLKLSAYPANPIPQNILDSNRQFAGANHNDDHAIPDLAIVAILQKPSRAAFATPLDLPPEIMAK